MSFSPFRKSLFTVTTQKNIDQCGRICGSCSYAVSKLNRHFSQNGDFHCSFYKSKYLIPQTNSSLISEILVPSSQHWILSRSYHRTAIRLKSKEESTVEKTVKALKEDSAQAVSKPPPAAVAEAKPSIWHRVVAELKHYYHGFRLLFIDIRVSSKLLWAILNGKTLTRREHKQVGVCIHIYLQECISR